MDLGGSRPAVVGDPAGSVPLCPVYQSVAGLPIDGADLRSRRDLCRFRWCFSGINSNGDGQHDGGDAAILTIDTSPFNRAAGISLLPGSGECVADSSVCRSVMTSLIDEQAKTSDEHKAPVSIASGSFWTPANLVFKALHPLMAAMVQMIALGQESFVAAASWDGGSVLCQGMAELLASNTDHGRPTWAQRR